MSDLSGSTFIQDPTTESRISRYLNDMEEIQREIIQSTESIRATADILLGPEPDSDMKEPNLKAEPKGKMGELADRINELSNRTAILRQQVGRLDDLR